MEARVILSEETKEKLKQPMSRQRRVELRWQKLEEAEKNGNLQFAKSRVDVAKLVGITNYKAGYSWVSSQIKKKGLIETITGYNEYNRAVYEYHLGTPLKYDNGRKKQSKPVTVKDTAPQFEPKVETGMVVTITQNGMAMKIENIKIDDLIKLIKMKGEN